MSLFFPSVSRIEWLKRELYNNSGSENVTMKLFSNNITPAESDVAGTYTEATFTGYVAKTLTSSQSGATWGVPTSPVSGTSSSTYGTNQVWSPSSAQTVYGYYWVGASSTTLLGAEAFGAGKPLSSGDTLTITPKLALQT